MGEANFIFGNPIGSFIYAVVSGLFGIYVKNDGNLLNWEPSFPGKWSYASLKLSYVKVDFKVSKIDGKVKQTYSISKCNCQALEFSVFLEPRRINNVE